MDENVKEKNDFSSFLTDYLNEFVLIHRINTNLRDKMCSLLINNSIITIKKRRGNL